MNLLARRSGRAQGARRLVMILLAVALAAAVALIFFLKAPSSGAADEAAKSTTAATGSVSGSPTGFPTPVTKPQVAPSPIAPPGEPATLDYRKLSLAAAQAVYTWDTRTGTYSGVYAHLRSWWEVLPDGSNPLTVFAQEFEATGINAAAFASLSGSHAYRSATVASSACDGQLAQVHQHPAPWVGLHVCTVTLRVTENQAAGDNSYTAPVSVMVNCPPAASAPNDRCAMVAFYATPNRIVY